MYEIECVCMRVRERKFETHYFNYLIGQTIFIYDILNLNKLVELEYLKLLGTILFIISEIK